MLPIPQVARQGPQIAEGFHLHQGVVLGEQIWRTGSLVLLAQGGPTIKPTLVFDLPEDFNGQNIFDKACFMLYFSHFQKSVATKCLKPYVCPPDGNIQKLESGRLF